MSYQEERLSEIANAIREKKGTTEDIPAVNFASEILSIETGINPSGILHIEENGTYDVTYVAKVNVNVAGGNYNIEVIDLGDNLVELKITTVNKNITEDINQDGSTLTIVKTNASVTQEGSTLNIGA